jgi:dimeric dUTPase (all-alpha-NTP-PPase superfamily)
MKKIEVQSPDIEVYIREAFLMGVYASIMAVKSSQSREDAVKLLQLFVEGFDDKDE